MTGGVRTTPRGRVAPDSTPVEARSPLAAALAGGAGRVLRDVDLPVLGKAKLRLLGHHEEQAVNDELARWLAGKREGGLELAGAGVTAERAVRTLAIAVRSPIDPALPFGSADEWATLDHGVIGAAWSRYEDLQEELDPCRDDVELSEAERAEIAHAVKKNSHTLLITFGAAKLTGYLLSSASQPASSSPPTS